MGVCFDCFEVLWEYCAGLLNNNVGVEYENLSSDDQIKAKSNAEEHLSAYIFVQNSASQQNSLKHELQNDYKKGDDQYPETRSAALMLLD